MTKALILKLPPGASPDGLGGPKARMEMSKTQRPATIKSGTGLQHLALGLWNLFGIWCLGFGAFPNHSFDMLSMNDASCTRSSASWRTKDTVLSPSVTCVGGTAGCPGKGFIKSAFCFLRRKPKAFSSVC